MSRKLVVAFLVAWLLALNVFFLIKIQPAQAYTTLTYKISQGTDNCERSFNGLDWSGWATNPNDVDAGYQGATKYKIGSGLRFQNVAIPNGATITSAHLEFYYGTYGMDLTLNYTHTKIRGEDADNSVTFSTSVDFDGRTRTTAYTDWTYIEPWYQNNWYNSPDIKTIVQEIVDRGGWTTGNNMTLFWDDFDDRSAHISYTERVAYSYSKAVYWGSDTMPRLVITYASGAGDTGTYVYQIHGPYYETGAVYPGIVNLTLSYLSTSPVAYMINGSSGTAEDLEIYSNQSAVCLFWNITASYQYQRVYYFSNTTSNSIYIYVPDNTVLGATQYSISVTDFAGLKNAYVEVTKNIGGYTQVIERRKLDVINNMPFWLVPFTQYNLRVVADEGTWSFELPADGTTTKQYVITKDMITQTYTGTNVTVTATRLNATTINVYFLDPTLNTNNITIQIFHVNTSIKSYTVDISYVDLTYTTNQTWLYALGDTDYTVNVTAYRHDGFNGYQTWIFPLPLSTVAVAQFWLSYFDVLGIFPIPTYQLPAVFICLLLFGVGSWRDSDIVSALSIIVCWFFQIIGWGSFPIAGLATAMMVVAFMYLHRGKQETVIFE